MAKLNFKIVTPEKVLLEQQADSIIFPTTTGQITVLPGHIPLISPLRSGELIAKNGSEIVPIAVSGGFVEVRPGNEVIVLADVAEHAEAIDVARAEEARKRAEEAMKDRKLSAQEYAELAATLQKNLTRLKVAKKHRARHGASSGVFRE